MGLKFLNSEHAGKRKIVQLTKVKEQNYFQILTKGHILDDHILIIGCDLIVSHKVHIRRGGVDKISVKKCVVKMILTFFISVLWLGFSI